MGIYTQADGEVLEGFWENGDFQYSEEVSPKDDGDEAAVTISQEHKESDYTETLKKLSKEEKFILLIGLLALYGDGEFSFQEIFQLRKIIAKIKLKPKDLILRDPTDQELSLDEKVVWALTLIKTNFINAGEFTAEEIIKIFKEITASTDQDIEADIKTTSKQRKYSDEIKDALVKIASADGKISPQEKKLIEVFIKTSIFQ